MYERELSKENEVWAFIYAGQDQKESVAFNYILEKVLLGRLTSPLFKDALAAVNALRCYHLAH